VVKVVNVVRLTVGIVGCDLTRGENLKEVHWSRVKRFARWECEVPKWVVEAAQRDAQRYVVDVLVDWGFDDDDRVMLKVQWEGFGREDDTWEYASELAKTAGRTVLKFLRTHRGENSALEDLITRQGYHGTTI